MMRLLAVSAVVAAVPSLAQDNIQSAPVQVTPRAETFSLPQVTPTPTPTPVATPTTTPPAPPVVVRTRPTPVAAAATPVVTRTPRAEPSSRTAPIAASTPAAVATAAPAPVPALTTPAATVVPATPAAVPVRASDSPPWVLIGGGALALLAVAVAATLLRRHRTTAAQPDPTPIFAAPPVPPRPVPVRPDLAMSTAPGLVTTLRPKEMWTRGPDAFLSFDLVVTNHGAEPADGVRVVAGLTTAGPGIADEVADWQAGADLSGATEPFAVRQGESHVMGGELKLPGDLMNVNEVNDRAMIVPVAMIALRWRGGLAVRTASDAFVIGTGDSTATKLGPIWVDRAGQRFDRLDARRFQPRV